MAKDALMGPLATFWKRPGTTRIGLDLAMLACLGMVAFLLFQQGDGLKPGEGAVLVTATAGLLILGRRWWEWQRRLARDGFLDDWAARIQEGEREMREIPSGLAASDDLLAKALNELLSDLTTQTEGMARLREAVVREWATLDGILSSVQDRHATEVERRSQGSARLEALGKELKAAMEVAFQPSTFEANHRLQLSHNRIQSQAFRAVLDQVRSGLEQFDDLLMELQDSFPRLRREEEALGRFADAGLRHGAKLSLAVKGLVAHTPRLVEEAQDRLAWLGRFRHSADEVRDQMEALSRRIEAFRSDAQSRIRSFSGARSTMKDLDQVAQQTGLLAVNAAILSQQDGGSAGMAAIGGRLRILADQTSAGASELDRALDQHHQGLERETMGLWDLQEATERLSSGIHDLMRMAGHLDQQNYDLERALESHLGLVELVRQAAGRAESSLQEARERSLGLEAALGRQWAVEAKILPERERLARLGQRMGEVGDELARISQRSMDGIRDILHRHKEVRHTDAYRQISDGMAAALFPPLLDPDPAWNRLTWARAQRRPRLASAPAALPPLGVEDGNGDTWLLLLGQDALSLPEPSAVEAWSCDAVGKVWCLRLLRSLQSEESRIEVLEALKGSLLPVYFPGVEMRIAPDGLTLNLPTPYPSLMDLLAGFGLKIRMEQGAWTEPFRPWAPQAPILQPLLWVGPDVGGGQGHPILRLVHAWVRDLDEHETFLPWLPYDGPRKPCPLRQDGDLSGRLDAPLPVRLLGLGADPSSLLPLKDRLLGVGAMEGEGGAILCTIGIGHAHPDALLLRLFQPNAGLAGIRHPDLEPYQARLREVLSGTLADPHQAAWALLEDLQRRGWVMPLPLALS